MRTTLYNVLWGLLAKHSCSEIQRMLSVLYERLANMSRTEPEYDFWMKCSRASRNLSSGMNKWEIIMVDALEGDVDDSEGG